MSDPGAPLTAGDVLSLDELRHLREISAARGAWLVLHAWLVIAGAMLAYVLWPGLLTGALAVAVLGSRQLGLAALAHEAVHWRLLPNAAANNWAATWLCAAPIWSELSAYRRRHHLHHRHLHQAEDPDRALGSAYAGGARRFWRD